MSGLALLLMVPLSCYGMLFILTVELPDVDCDRANGKRNILSSFGPSAGLKGSFIATCVGTMAIFIIWRFLERDMTNLLGPLFVFSAISLLAASYGVVRVPTTRTETMIQVKLNFLAMISFLLIMDVLGFLL